MNWASFVVLACLVSQKSVVHPCHVPLCPHVLGLTEPLRRPISVVGPEGVGLVSGGHLHAVGRSG